jgi:serine/threonine-protein kinase HipA
MREILVYAAWQGLVEPRIMGRLSSSLTRGQEILSFEYDASWLRDEGRHQLDPALQLYSGAQYPRSKKPNFGLFLDSSPDRWGRSLQDRREAQTARLEGRAPVKLQPTDYLLGVHDLQRLGGLRFKLASSGDFLANDSEMAVPPWAKLAELEHAAREIERESSTDAATYSKWLAMLVAPGGSLGGARPKAGVVDSANRLWIAKFPGRTDLHDVGGWELVAQRLATDAGVATAPSMCRRLHSPHHTFLTERFDRTATGKTVHFASAMTLLGRNDGDDASNGASYLEIAEIVVRSGADPEEDLSQLWRRIVFNICISNTDDHLRNHGFLLAPSGWRLSPAFDMNPVVGSTGLKLLISDSDNSLDLDLALEVAEFFRLSSKSAGLVLDQVVASVRNWRSIAHSVGLSPKEVEEMAGAFRPAR